ncbi:MAG: DUF1318 domain-containing protein [Nitrospirota bacterium]
MSKKAKFITVVLFICVFSCAVITVNIYFPEKEVKEAYKTLEKELMKPMTEEEGIKKEGNDTSGTSILFDLIPAAYAQEKDLPERIAEIVKKMPDVVAAYKDMGARLAEIDRLRDKGVVGESNKGLLIVREGKLSSEEQKLVEAENRDRQTVMRGMARAIIRINRVPENEENLRSVMPQAVEQFASIRRDSAKKGWWIQDPSGNWVRK